MSKVAQKTSKRSSVIPEAPASKQDDERSAAVDRFAGYAGSVVEYVDISREALNELFSACTNLWTLVASSKVVNEATARVQWDRAREAFIKGVQFAAIAANDLDEATIRELFDVEADEDTNVESTLSRTAE